MFPQALFYDFNMLDPIPDWRSWDEFTSISDSTACDRKCLEDLACWGSEPGEEFEAHSGDHHSPIVPPKSFRNTPAYEEPQTGGYI